MRRPETTRTTIGRQDGTPGSRGADASAQGATGGASHRTDADGTGFGSTDPITSDPEGAHSTAAGRNGRGTRDEPARKGGRIWRSLLRHAPALLGLVLLVGAIYVVQREFRHLKLKDIGDALHGIPTRALAFSFVWTVLSYFVLTFYDRLGTIYAGHKVSYGRVAFASFCAYSLSHNLGFAAVSGAAVRYRLYAHWGLTPLQIGKTVAFCSLTFGLGGMVLGGAILFVEPRAVPFFGHYLPLWGLWGIGALLWAIVLGYVTLSRILGTFRMFGHEIELPGWRMAVIQVILATVDVAITATIFYALLPEAPGLTWLIFLGVYVASYTAGLAANLPGGIGVFDTAMLLGLEPYLDAPHIVGAIVVFRLYYYVIPLFLAGGMFAGNEILLRGGALFRGGGLPRLQGLGRWSEPTFAVTAATASVALCGVLMLCLGVLAPQGDFSWLDPDYADLASQAGQFVPSLIGAGLVMMAVALSQRVNLAWGLTILLLVAGAAFAVTQDDRLWVAGVLVLTTLLLAPFRSCFYRHAKLISGPLEPTSALSLIVLVICLSALALTRPHTHIMSNNAWWAIVLSPDVPNSLRLAVAVTVVLALLAIWRLLRPGRVRFLPWDASARARVAALGGKPPEAADGVVLGEAERAAIPFRRVGRVLLGLGDPTGSDSDRVSAIWRLRDLAQQEGMDAAFWRAGPDLLKVYDDLGLTALPLGPDGLPMPEAPENTPETDQYLVCLAERDLNVLLPLLPQLAGNQDRPAAGKVA
ncbi:MAG: lysylphosphatidylglycerol synthetase family protein [Rhodospirillales bacterium]|nr:lysylphosphatidylglycerol synthetase family protein [Rhodospirillales bacterium]